MASNGAENSSSILEEHVVGNDLVHMLSFTATRSPARGPAPDEGYEEVPESATSALVG